MDFDLELCEVSNVIRTNISRRRINRKNKKTKLTLENQALFICKDELSEKYIHNSFSKFEGGYIYYDMDEDEVLAFCLWKKYDNMDEKRLHILLLCSKYPSYNLGSTMLNDIEYYCFENKITSITVSPASDRLIEYYKKFGFINIVGTKDMIKYLTPIAVQRRKYNKTRKLPSTKKKYPLIASMMPIDLNVTKNQLF